VVSKYLQIRSNQSYSVYRHSSLILLFHCMNGADRTGTIKTRTPGGAACAHLQLEVRTRGAECEPRSILRPVFAPRVRTRGAHAAPVRSYCFTVETELIGPAMLNGAPPKHDDMQCVAYVPEMSHFVVPGGASSWTNSKSSHI
jgi:hypothetical protein